MINGWAAYPWYQHDEDEYIRGLGRHSATALREWDARGPSRLELLRSYRESLKHRTTWGQLRPDECLAVVEAEIALELANIRKA